MSDHLTDVQSHDEPSEQRTDSLFIMILQLNLSLELHYTALCSRVTFQSVSIFLTCPFWVSFHCSDLLVFFVDCKWFSEGVHCPNKSNLKHRRFQNFLQTCLIKRVIHFSISKQPTENKQDMTAEIIITEKKWFSGQCTLISSSSGKDSSINIFIIVLLHVPACSRGGT